MEEDRISDMPSSIKESILTRLPIREAVMMSILSRAWRTFPTLTDGYFSSQGMISKSRSLSLEKECFRVPSCLFNCSELTCLDISNCELDLPPTVKGFLNFRTLNLHQVLVTADAIERLILSCPLLENLSLSYFDCLAITILAPNLKHLHLEGELKDIVLKNTLSLVAITVAIYMTDDTGEPLEQGSEDCKLVKFLGAVTLLKLLVGHIYFTKYMSVGDYPATLSIKYDHLKVNELYQVGFEDMKEVLVILRLITSSPNPKELTISVLLQMLPMTWTFGRRNALQITHFNI